MRRRELSTNAVVVEVQGSSSTAHIHEKPVVTTEEI